jgi:hypothetical protein
MAFVLFEKPATPKRIPRDRNDPSAFGLDFIFDSILVDKMQDYPKNSYGGEKE